MHEEHRIRFSRLVNGLETLLNDIRADENPKATYFVTAGAMGCSLCVVNLFRHTGQRDSFYDGEVLAEERIKRLDCGDPNFLYEILN